MIPMNSTSTDRRPGSRSLTRRNQGERGNTLLEFAVCSVFIIPMLFGTFVLGMNLTRGIQVTQVCRDSGHMYVRQVDFSQPGNQDMLVRLAQGLGLQRTGGNGVVILSKMTYIGDAQCTAAGLVGAQCVNRYQHVIMQRIVIGNSAQRSSAYGTPNSGLLDASGNVQNYITETSARAVNFSNTLTLGPGELAYVSEAYFPSPDYDMPGFQTGTGVAARAIF